MVVKNLFIDLKKAYAGKKVLITGHTGFKGSWLALQLRMMGAEVMGFALPPNVHGSHFERLGLIKSVCHVYGDICDRENFTRHFLAFEPEVVFRLAAQAIVSHSYETRKAIFHFHFGY